MGDIFDEARLMENVDDDLEFLEETIVMLDEDSPALLEQIQAAAQAEDASALVKPAHALKGMVANFCAPHAEAAARALEEMAREDRLTDTHAAVERVHRETERLLEALREFLKARTQ